jgi:hypothetical protein
MCHTNPISARKKPVHLLSMALALGVALFAAPGSAAPPPAASSVTVFNCLVAPTTPVPCGSGELCAGHLHVTFSSYNSNDTVQTIAYETSPYLDSRASSTASPSSTTLSCATSDGCLIKGVTEACGSAGTSENSCGLDAESNTVSGAIELDRSGFVLVFNTWTGVCRTQVCSGCVP